MDGRATVARPPRTAGAINWHVLGVGRRNGDDTQMLINSATQDLAYESICQVVDQVAVLENAVERFMLYGKKFRWEAHSHLTSDDFKYQREEHVRRFEETVESAAEFGGILARSGDVVRLTKEVKLASKTLVSLKGIRQTAEILKDRVGALYPSTAEEEEEEAEHMMDTETEPTTPSDSLSK